MGKKVIYLCFICLLFLSNAFCDTIIFKSGKQLDGSIKERTNEAVKIDIEGITLTYYLTDIESINGEKITTAVSSSSQAVESSAPVVSDSATMPVTEDPETTPDATEEAINEDTAAPLESAMPLEQENKNISAPQENSSGGVYGVELNKEISKLPSGKINEREAKMAVAFAGGIFLFVLILSLVFYVYTALCLYFIAKKTATSPEWLAWIPIANLFLMCKIAKLSYWWLLGIFGLFIPIVNILANFYWIGLFVFMWYKIAEARNKPGWIGILTIIPIANLVVMGYLAFSE